MAWVPCCGVGIAFSPSSVLKVEHRPILELKKDDWLAMREVNGNIILND